MRPGNSFYVTMAAALLLLGFSSAVGAEKAVTTAAASLSPLEIETAKADLASPDWILRARAMKVLGDGRVEAAIPAIEAIYASAESPWLRGRALGVLAKFRGKAMLPAARKDAKDPAAPLRAAAIEALGAIGDAQAVADVQAALKDADAVVRCEALVAYARLAGAAAWKTVSEAAASADAPVVRAAARALVCIPGEEGHRKLLELLEHGEEGVRTEAASGLGQIHYAPAIPPLLAHYAADNSEQVRLRSRKALLVYESRALVAPLLKALQGDDPTCYEAALRVLSVCAAQAEYDEIARVLRGADARYTRSLPLAMELLAQSDADRYHDLFVQFIRSDDARVRTQAVKSLARCQNIDHFSALRPLLADQDADVAVAALASLLRYTKGAPAGGIVAYLAAPLKSTNPRVGEAALTLLEDRLAATETVQATAALGGILSGADDRLRLHAAKALASCVDDDARGVIARRQGYLTEWSVAGPFPNDAHNAGMALIYPPEQAIDLDKTYGLPDVSTTQPAAAQGFFAQVKAVKAAWSSFQVKQATGRFTLNEVPYPAGGNVVYFYATFQSAADKAVVLSLPPLPSEAAIEKFTVWFNDRKLELPKPAPKDPRARGKEAEQDATEIDLPGALVKGPNHVLIKAAVENADVGRWTYFVRLVDADGKPVEALKFKPVD